MTARPATKTMTDVATTLETHVSHLRGLSDDDDDDDCGPSSGVGAYDGAYVAYVRVGV